MKRQSNFQKISIFFELNAELLNFEYLKVFDSLSSLRTVIFVSHD